MAFRDVYVGWLGKDGSLDWGGDYRTGNIPGRQSPFFTGVEFYYLIQKKIDDGDIPGEQVDWAAWAASVSKQQILDLLDECYGDSRRSFGEFEEFVRCLPDDRNVALVALSSPGMN